MNKCRQHSTRNIFHSPVLKRFTKDNNPIIVIHTWLVLHIVSIFNQLKFESIAGDDETNRDYREQQNNYSNDVAKVVTDVDVVPSLL